MTLLLVDGTNAVMRRVTAVGSEAITPDLAAKDTAQRILRAARDLDASHLIVALDAPNNWRYALFPEYKGVESETSLKTTPYSLALGEALEAKGVKIIAVPSYEADDVLATLARRASNNGRRCLLLSSDNDLYQLLQFSNVNLVQFAPKGEAAWLTIRTSEHCLEKFGVEPRLYADYLTLVGGKNKVPGIPKIGPKTAPKLLALGGIEKLIALGKIPNNHVDWARTALKLHTLVSDIPLGPLQPKECQTPSSL